MYVGSAALLPVRTFVMDAADMMRGEARVITCFRGQVGLWGYVRDTGSRLVLSDDWGGELELWPAAPDAAAIAACAAKRRIVTRLAEIVYPWEMMLAAAAVALPTTRGYQDALQYALRHSPSMAGLTIEQLLVRCGLAAEFIIKLR